MTSQFAETLYKSMKGLGTKDNSLIRTIISRCEVDMVQIKDAFQQAYNGPLGKWIKVRYYVLQYASKLIAYASILISIIVICL